MLAPVSLKQAFENLYRDKILLQRERQTLQRLEDTENWEKAFQANEKKNVA